MFSGIIQNKSKVLSVTKRKDIVAVTVRLPKGWRFVIGQSVAIDGICSTVVTQKENSFSVEFMPETLRMTTAISFKKGDEVNLERSLRYGDFVDGHFVQGHVEGVGVVREVRHAGESTEITFSIPKQLVRYVAPKGSIAVNGVSLTVARLSKTTVTVALIPHTLGETNLGSITKGGKVNIETDMLARYLNSLLASTGAQ
jgi:riboflavin synthase